MYCNRAQLAARCRRFCSLMPTFATPVLVWKIIALLSLPWTAFFLVPYLFKCVMYPHKASTAGRDSSERL